jgi:hypothetical protein
MAVLKASRLKAVLDKARNAGQVEESVTIAGLDLSFRSLHSEAYNDILAELNEVSETSYPMCYQIEHVCRSLVEIDGQDLRDVDYVEVEGEGVSGPVKVERHQWVRDNLVSTWSREMVQIAFRKVLDAVAGAEQKASEGVQFRVESESDEEKYRRLLSEAKEVAADVPDELRAAILKELGLLEGASLAELESLDMRARTWAAEDGAPKVDEVIAVEEPPTPVGPPRAPVQIVQAATSDFAEAATERPEELMARRTPLNRTAIQEPMPQAQPESVASVANRRSPPPPADQVHTVSSRYAAIEGLAADPNFEPQHMPGQNPYEGNDPVVLEQRRVPVDKEGAKTILDKPPVSGRNPKYSPRAGSGLNPRSR